jgi:hypothetical protein
MATARLQQGFRQVRPESGKAGEILGCDPGNLREGFVGEKRLVRGEQHIRIREQAREVVVY